MKKFYKIRLVVLFAITSLFSIKTQAQFIDYTATLGITNNTLSCIHFVNDSVGFVGGWGGVILHTTDRGDNWNIKNPANLSGKTITSIFFTNSDTGFVTTADYGPLEGSIFRTDDAGITWNLVQSDTFPLSSVAFPSRDTGYAVGYRGKRYRTIDGGLTWASVGNNLGASMLYDVRFLDNNTGYLTHGSGRVYKTMNAGVNWTLVYDFVTPAGPSNRIWVFDQNEAYWVLTSKVYHTTDGGANWTEKLDAVLPLNDIYFTSSSTGFVVGVNGNVYRTMDGGMSWEHFIMEVKMPYRLPVIGGAYFKDGYNGIIVGDSGMVAKFLFVSSVQGKVTNNAAQPITEGNVLLLKKRPIDVKMDTVDMYNLGITGNGDYLFQTVPAGDYLIRAVPDSSFYPGHLATYYGDVVFWNKATVVNIIQDQSGLDIVVKDTIPQPSGNSIIAGMVAEGSNFGGKVLTLGDPIKGVNVSLLKNSVPVLHDVTNDSGQFRFYNVDSGTYSIFADVPGVPVDTNNLVVTTGDSVNVQVTVDSFLVSFDLLSSFHEVMKPLPVAIVSLYPNPSANGKLYLELEHSGSNKEALSIAWYNTLGQKVHETSLHYLKSGNNVVELDTHALGNGIYMLGMEYPDSQTGSKGFVKIAKVAVMNK